MRGLALLTADGTYVPAAAAYVLQAVLIASEPFCCSTLTRPWISVRSLHRQMKLSSM